MFLLGLLVASLTVKEYLRDRRFTKA